MSTARRALARFGATAAVVASLMVAGPIWAAEPDEDQSKDGAAEERNADDDSKSDEGDTFEWSSERELFEIESPDSQQDQNGGDDSGDQTRQPRIPLSEMSKEEARRAGFEFGSETGGARRAEAVIMGATAGLFVHGTGHWYSQKPRTGAFLLGMEGLGLALGTAGLVTWNLGGDEPAGAAVGTRLFHVGTGLFALSYILDVVGSVRAGGGTVSGGRDRKTSITAEAGYRFLSARNYPLNHHFHVDVDVQVGRFFGRVATDHDFELEASNYELEVGARWFQGTRPATQAYALLGGGHFAFRGTGPFNRWRGEVRLGASADLGLVASHLDGVAVGLEAGYGRTWYNGTAPTPDPPSLAVGFIPVEIYTSFQITRRVRTRIAFEQTPELQVQPGTDLVGVGRLEVVYDSSELFDLEVGVEGGPGGGFSAFGNLRVDVL